MSPAACMLLLTCCLCVAWSTFSEHKVLRDAESLENETLKKTEATVIQLPYIAKHDHDHEYGTIAKERDVIRKTTNATIAVKQDKITTTATAEDQTTTEVATQETRKGHQAFLDSGVSSPVSGADAAPSDDDSDKPIGVTTTLSVTTENDEQEQTDVDEVSDDTDEKDDTSTTEEGASPSIDLEVQLAYREYMAQTNFIPRTQAEKYAQLLASYRFMTLAKGDDWTHLEDPNFDYSKFSLPTYYPAEPIPFELTDPQRKKIIEDVTSRTYLNLKRQLERTSSSVKSVPPDVTTTLSSVFGTKLPQCPKKKITYKTSSLGGKLNVRKPMRRFNDNSRFSDKSGVANVDHKFYKSRYVRNSSYFEEYWSNITSSAHKLSLHTTASKKANKHSYMQKLRFEFPFFGHNITNVTVSTGGYIMTGVSGPTWSTDAEGLMPFMTDFDTKGFEDTDLKVFDDRDKMTFLWENIPLHGTVAKYTFASTLYENGDITFAYKDVPITVEELRQKQLPVSIGLADSFLINKIAFYVRRKASHTYTRLSFEDLGVVGGSVLHLLAQPACPQHTTCPACTTHFSRYSNFKCVWCEKLQKCTSGSDYNRPLVSACHFSETCNQSLGPVGDTPADDNISKN